MSVNIVTIADQRFFPLAQRLFISLLKSGCRCTFTSFCDDVAAFAPLKALGRCELRPLPEIRTLGAKRAKFAAYTRALAELGSFLYLDSDIIVVGDLSELGRSGKLQAVEDDLSACPFIEDRRHPWPGAPELVNDCYINSGVLFIPAALNGFFEHLHDRSESDTEWSRYIFPGKLYDNHFLCAHINIGKIPVDLIDPQQYNWPGFMKNGQLQVVRRGDSLVNKVTGVPLQLAHFAGVADVDRALCSFPLDVASLLCERSIISTGSTLHEFTRLQASMSSQLPNTFRDDFLLTVFGRLRSELLHLSDGGWQRDFRTQQSYHEDPDSVLSLAYSLPNSDTLWNGLRCGGAYLEGSEYNYLADIVERERIQTALETGAGETSICFRRLGVETISIEATLGPWLERARSAGCKVVHVPFQMEPPEFEKVALGAALRDAAPNVDLLFIDSPVGSRSRSRILTQLLQMVRPRLILFHDAHRDSPYIYRYEKEHGLKMVDYLPSRRGMVLFAYDCTNITVAAKGCVDLSQVRCSIKISTWPSKLAAGEEFEAMVTLENHGQEILSSDYAHPVHVAYHWIDECGRMLVYDGIRTRLPFELRPNNAATFPIRVVAPQAEGRCRAQVTLVQEAVQWFDDGEGGAWLWVESVIQPDSKDELDDGLPRPERDRFQRRIQASTHSVTSDIEADRDFVEIYQKCREYTITSFERMYATYQAVCHVSERGVAGDFVECGVWMGGNCMLAALTLLARNDAERHIWLYDTFDGMPRPSPEDVRHDGQDALSLWEPQHRCGEASRWWNAPYETVRANLLSTGYQESYLRFIKGRVEETLPKHRPEQIAVLRLDTDWYASTRHEMTNLFPRLATGGVLILDDYGWWLGSKQAVDEFLEANGLRLLLARIDSCGARLAIKL